MDQDFSPLVYSILAALVFGVFAAAGQLDWRFALAVGLWVFICERRRQRRRSRKEP